MALRDQSPSLHNFEASDDRVIGKELAELRITPGKSPRLLGCRTHFGLESSSRKGGGFGGLELMCRVREWSR